MAGPYQYGTDSHYGVPITIHLTFDGTSTPWGTANLYSMAPLTNRAESIDGSYEISNLDVELIDTNGSIWGSLGHGTTAFYKPFAATVYVGGRRNESTYGPSSLSRLPLQDLTNSATYTVHSGRIVEVSKKDRKVRIKSQNNLRSVADLEWKFPFTPGAVENPTRLGSYMLYSNNLATSYPNSVFDLNEEGNAFSVYAAITAGSTNTLDGLPYWYPATAGKGTLGLKSGYVYPGTQFYTDFTIVKFKGTWMQTKTGTIDTLEEAYRYGFSSLSDAEAAKGVDTYTIMKTRLNIEDGTLLSSNGLYLQQNLFLEETPANLFRELIAGHCVTQYFGTEHIEQQSFGTSQRHTTYQTFSQRIDPKGGKVLPSLKDLIQSTYGLFSVNTSNQFEYRAYGPRNLQANIGTIDGTTLLDSSFSNAIEEAKNRVVVRYGFSPVTGEFGKQIEVKQAGWSGTADNPLIIESKWLQDNNEANVFAKRVLSRFAFTSPKIALTVTAKHSGVGLGSLFNVVDPDSGLNNKVVEVVAYSKDFTDERKIQLECIDGESVYSRRGYGQWMGGTVQPSGAVSGTSTFGWGTGGTQANINAAIYGSQFVWW